jgi:hypothetical protein
MNINILKRKLILSNLIVLSGDTCGVSEELLTYPTTWPTKH